MVPSKLAADYELTHDVLAFHPEKGNASILVMGAVEGVPAPWYAIVGIGRRSGSLVTPKNSPVPPETVPPEKVPQELASGGVLLLDGAGFSANGPEIHAIGPTPGVILGTIYLINNADIQGGTQEVVKAVQANFSTSGKTKTVCRCRCVGYAKVQGQLSCGVRGFESQCQASQQTLCSSRRSAGWYRDVAFCDSKEAEYHDTGGKCGSSANNASCSGWVDQGNTVPAPIEVQGTTQGCATVDVKVEEPRADL
jgi:hypothetical protein